MSELYCTDKLIIEMKDELEMLIELAISNVSPSELAVATKLAMQQCGINVSSQHKVCEHCGSEYNFVLKWLNQNKKLVFMQLIKLKNEARDI